MHTSISKQLAQGVLKAGRASRNNLKYVLFANSINKNSNVSLHSSFTRNFSEEGGQFEKVTSYESLISRICNASNINDLFNIMNQNLSLYKNEHIVLTLRVLARLIKSNSSQTDLLHTDKRYIDLTAKAQESLEEFNEYEILDFIFWLRRFKIAKLPIHIKDENLDKLFAKVTEFVKSKSFNFRNLVNLYYDLSSLRRNTDHIIDEIYNELKADFKLLTPFTIVQILQAASRKGSNASQKEFFVVDYVQRNLDSMLQEFDNDQKCLVFKYLADMELHLNPPQYKIPGVLFKLKTQLKENLDQLSEVGVLNILDAYINIPKEFHSDLLDEIKEMVIVTIQHNSENIKSFFLIDFLEKNLSFSRGRRLVEDEILTIYEEIANRVVNDDFIGKFKIIERILSIYDKVGVQYTPLLDNIVARINQSSKFFSGSIIRSLISHKVDVTPIVKKFIENGGFDSAEGIQRVQLYIILSQINNPEFQEIQQQLRTELLENSANLVKYCTLAAPLQAADEEIYNKLVEALKSQDLKNADFVFWKNVLFTINNKSSRISWIEWFNANSQDLSPSIINKFIDAFFSVDQITTERILFFSSVFDQLDATKIPYKKLLLNIKNNSEFLYEFSRIENRFTKFFKNIIYAMEQVPQDARLQSIYSFVKRLESLNIRSPIIPKLVEKAYSIAKSNSDRGINFKLELQVSNYLIQNGLTNSFKPEQALALYTAIKGKFEENIYGSKLYTYYLQKSSAETLQSEEVKKEVTQKLDNLAKKLNETGAKTVLSTVAELLSYPPQFLEPHKEAIVKALKSFLNFGNSSLYQNILFAIPSVYVRENYDFYAPIIKELIVNYSNFNKRIAPAELIQALKAFAEFGTRNPTIYNNILADIGRLFQVFRSEELLEIVLAFTRIRIKQTDLFDKILGKVADFPNKFFPSIKTLFINLYVVGANSPQAKISVPEIMSAFKNASPKDLVAGALYGSILGLENEAQFFETLLGGLKGVNPDSFKNFQIRTFALFGEYLRIAYPKNPEYVDVIRAMIRDYDTDAKGVFKASGQVNKVREVIGEYLNLMKVEYKTDFVINDAAIDVYLPATKQVVKIFVPRDINFDRASLSGRGILAKKIYSSFEGYTPVFLNWSEFKSIPENLNRINYLIASGIKSNNDGKYDFSQLRSSKAQEEVTEEVEHEVEEGAVVEEDEEVKSNN